MKTESPIQREWREAVSESLMMPAGSYKATDQREKLAEIRERAEAEGVTLDQVD